MLIDNVSAIEPLDWVAIVGIFILFWESFLRPAVKRVFFGVFRGCRWLWKSLKVNALDPLKYFVLRKQHGQRIDAIVVDNYDDYRGLPDADQRLFSMLRSKDHMRMLFKRVEDLRDPDWLVEERTKADNAFMTTLVFTENKNQLECWNCAFFVADLDKKRAYARNPFGGHCHRELPSQETRPGGFCSHHSATQGYSLSQAGVYNIAPVADGPISGCATISKPTAGS